MDFLFHFVSEIKNIHLQPLKKILTGDKINVSLQENLVVCSSDKKKVAVYFNTFHLLHHTQKVAAIITSKLGLNKTIFARNCEVRKIDKHLSEDFLKRYHLMNSTQSAFNFGLFFKNELVAVASFSKGRKMNRLPSNKRSYELIRFCCKQGLTVTGGLTKLVKNFCIEKEAGDVMTYVDKQLSDGNSFIRAGFLKLGETEPNYFLVNKLTFEIIPVKDKNAVFDSVQFSLEHNLGNIKLVYTPVE